MMTDPTSRQHINRDLKAALVTEAGDHPQPKTRIEP